jgi:dephospho-CoA kinase
MKLIGLTGSIASGKTLLCKELEKKNYQILDCDLIGRELLNEKKIQCDIKNLLSLKQNLEINHFLETLRNALIVEEKRMLLEDYLHPKIFEHLKFLMKKAEDNLPIIMSISAPTALSKISFPWSVKLSLESHCLLRMQRLKERYPQKTKSFLRKLSELHDSFKTTRAAWADHLIWNNASEETLIKQALLYLNKTVEI